MLTDKEAEIFEMLVKNAGTAITKAQILAHVWGADAKLVNEDLKILTPRMKNLTFKKKIILSQKIKINREDFMQIFSILMDNAIKYAGSKIYLELGEHELIVKNDGATIPKEALPHIFERFYQVDKTANGVGLGLAIAKSLAERNHWELTASSESQKICFKLSF